MSVPVVSPDAADIQAVLDAYESKPYPESDPCSGVTP